MPNVNIAIWSRMLSMATIIWRSLRPMCVMEMFPLFFKIGQWTSSSLLSSSSTFHFILEVVKTNEYENYLSKYFNIYHRYCIHLHPHHPKQPGNKADSESETLIWIHPRRKTFCTIRGVGWIGWDWVG